MSERDGFVDRLTLEEAQAEILRLDGLLAAEKQAGLDQHQGAMRTIWMLLWSVPTHQIKVTRAVQETYETGGRPNLDRRDMPEDGATLFTARLLP